MKKCNKTFLIFQIGLLRNISFCVILCKAGLRLKFSDITQLKFLIARKSLIPCLVEAAAFSVVCYLILKLTAIWSVLLA